MAIVGSRHASPAGLNTAQVEMGTGYAVTPACPARGPTYTEYFVNSVPQRQAAVGVDGCPGGWMAVSSPAGQPMRSSSFMERLPGAR